MDFEVIKSLTYKEIVKIAENPLNISASFHLKKFCIKLSGKEDIVGVYDVFNFLVEKEDYKKMEELYNLLKTLNSNRLII